MLRCAWNLGSTRSSRSGRYSPATSRCTPITIQVSHRRPLKKVFLVHFFAEHAWTRSLRVRANDEARSTIDLEWCNERGNNDVWLAYCQSTHGTSDPVPSDVTRFPRSQQLDACASCWKLNAEDFSYGQGIWYRCGMRCTISEVTFQSVRFSGDRKDKIATPEAP